MPSIFDNRFTGSNHELAYKLGTKGMKEKAKRMKWYLWIPLAIFLAYTLGTFIFSCFLSVSPFWYEYTTDANTFIQYIINAKKDGLTPEFQALQDLLSNSFGWQINDYNLYNTFAQGYISGQNKDLVNQLMDKINNALNNKPDDPNLVLATINLKLLIQVENLFKTVIVPNDYIASRFAFPMVLGFSLVIGLWFPFTYDTGMMGPIPTGNLNYKSYLMNRKIKDKKPFYSKPWFVWTISLIIFLTAISLNLSFAIHRYLNDNSDVIINGYTLETIPAIILGVGGFFFTLFYSQLIVINDDYIKALKQTPDALLEVSINYVNRKYQNMPWFKDAQNKNRVVKTPSELKENLGVKPIDDNKKDIE